MRINRGDTFHFVKINGIYIFTLFLGHDLVYRDLSVNVQILIFDIKSRKYKICHSGQRCGYNDQNSTTYNSKQKEYDRKHITGSPSNTHKRILLPCYHNFYISIVHFHPPYDDTNYSVSTKPILIILTLKRPFINR